jgi:carbamoyltransferase
VFANRSERFSGIKNDAHLHKDLIDYALKWGKPDKVVWYESPFLKTIRQLHAGQGWKFSENNVKKYLNAFDINVPVSYTKHHNSHAAYAYYTQPHDHCAVICLDSIGEFECLTIWDCYNNNMHKVYSKKYPHSLGLFYSAMTQRIGLVPQRDEYLVTEWSKRGDGKDIIQLMKDELIDVDYMKMRQNLHRGCKWWHPELVSQQDMYDIASATQSIFEEMLCKLSIFTKDLTNAKHIALAGGCAHNKQAIDLIRNQWESVWVPPNPGDSGSSVGAVLAKTKRRTDNISDAWNIGLQRIKNVV